MWIEGPKWKKKYATFTLEVKRQKLPHFCILSTLNPQNSPKHPKFCVKIAQKSTGSNGLRPSSNHFFTKNSNWTNFKNFFVWSPLTDIVSCLLLSHWSPTVISGEEFYLMGSNSMIYNLNENKISNSSWRDVGHNKILQKSKLITFYRAVQDQDIPVHEIRR